MNLWRWITGVMKIQLMSAELEKNLSLINHHKIALYHLQKTNELSCDFWIQRKDFPVLEVLFKKSGSTIKVCKKIGGYWYLNNLWKRSVLLLGIVILLFAVLVLPQRVLFVTVTGNKSIPSQQIIDTAQKCGIYFGALRREVRSEKVKNRILSQIPQLQWAGVNTYGCVAEICVRERSVDLERERPSQVSSIVAARDGYIVAGTVTQGTQMFEVGQSVRLGQVLVSGYADCGTIQQSVQAEGEILAQTKRELIVKSSGQYLKRRGELNSKKRISVLLGKKRINLWKDSGISPASCGRMYREYYVTLPGSFVLPVALCVDSYRQYDASQEKVSENEGSFLLSSFVERYLPKHMAAGKILQSEEWLTEENGAWKLHGTYICEEMIGRQRQEQIGDIHGKER